MQNQSFHFEISDLIKQFTAALDGCVINRYHTKTRNVADRIEVGYVYAPKQKVLADLVDPAATVKLPIVAFNITQLQYDRARVFNKLEGFTFPQGITDTETGPQSDFVPSPVPVNISLNLSILAKYQRDMDQILQNFVVYSNPYFIISWKMPAGLMSNLTELRSKVIWDGNISLTTPMDITAEKTSHIVADTTFKIEGWLFPAKFTDVGNIFKIEENLIPVANIETCNK